MGRNCAVCVHSDRQAIEAKIAAGTSLTMIAHRFEVWRTSLVNHMQKNHANRPAPPVPAIAVLPALVTVPEPDPEPEDDEPEDDSPPDSLAVALQLIESIAEDPGLRPSYRVKARQHLRALRRPLGLVLSASDFADPPPAADEADTEAEEAGAG